LRCEDRRTIPSTPLLSQILSSPTAHDAISRSHPIPPKCVRRWSRLHLDSASAWRGPVWIRVRLGTVESSTNARVHFDQRRTSPLSVHPLILCRYVEGSAGFEGLQKGSRANITYRVNRSPSSTPPTMNPQQTSKLHVSGVRRRSPIARKPRSLDGELGAVLGRVWAIRYSLLMISSQSII